MSLGEKEVTQEELQALLAAASAPRTEQEPEVDLSSVEQFIIALNIKPGKTKISARHLWATYQEWAKFPIHQNTFFKEFSKKMYDSKRRNSWDHFYLLDSSSFDMTSKTKLQRDADIREAREQRRVNRLRKTHTGKAI